MKCLSAQEAYGDGCRPEVVVDGRARERPAAPIFSVGSVVASVKGKLEPIFCLSPAPRKRILVEVVILERLRS